MQSNGNRSDLPTLISALTLAICAYAGTAYGSGNVVLQHMLIVKHAVSSCPEQASSIFSTEKILKFGTNFNNLILVLAKRASILHPGLSEANIKDELVQQMSRIAAQIRGKYGTPECHERGLRAYSNVLNRVISPKYSAFIENYRSNPFQFNTPQQAQHSSPEAETYATPSLQNIVRETIARTHYKEISCAKIQIKKISLESKEVRETKNLPIFLLAPIKYTERWTTICGGLEKMSEIIFSNDSDGPLGNYIVKSVNP